MLRNILAGGAALAVLAGAGTAFAANSGKVDLDTSAAHFDGNYNFYKARPGAPKHYDTALKGKFRNTEDDQVYLQARPDRCSFRTYKELKGKGSAQIDTVVPTGSTLIASRVSVRVCESHWGPDQCDEQEFAR